MTPQRFNEQSHGVYTISATPFTDNGALDLESTDSLVDFYLEKGVDGLTILGILGEAPKLTFEESLQFTKRVIARAQGLPIVVGASNVSTLHIQNLTEAVMDAGAAGIMLAPSGALKTDEQVYQYVSGVLKALGSDVPVCYQDYPQATGVSTSLDVLSRLIDEFPQIIMMKHEEFPGLRKLTQLRRHAEQNNKRRISVLVGNNGLYIPQEMRRGADGMMTGFSYPEMLVEVARLFREGKPEEAEDEFDLYLPFLKHEFQMGISLAIRKEVLRRRGLLSQPIPANLVQR
ncbi:dihydrodipicolinate synthase family protein [Paenalcaligenes niemegkensis]|uniref:dihydrodipicolinate synthase family protein n=1 Tax=Paenalcaligenes niemegkensis TaxID=2895469 RepID=UPI001EE8BC0F|nr:dihydrodipicolinate synthase family protein [Paenalcaligenes niemegkensis]MCQ9618052.1 dihydrodipicolinate synthase family protein [Paenalcaligenes niemegkensis]